MIGFKTLVHFTKVVIIKVMLNKARFILPAIANVIRILPLQVRNE